MSLQTGCLSLPVIMAVVIGASAWGGMRNAYAEVKADSVQWVVVGDDGNLQYRTTPTGDRFIDFSHAGFGGGGVAIPMAMVQKEVSPSGADDTAAIQQAIDAVSAMPLKEGLRGAILLQAGTYHCAEPLKLTHHGVVLQGSGSGKDGSGIEMTGAAHTCIVINGERTRQPKPSAETSFAVTDKYLPCGTESLSVKDASGLKVGDTILIQRPASEQWIHFMGMDKLVRDGKPQTWIKKDSLITTERMIRSIDGNRITLDVPLTDAIDCQFLGSAVATVVKVAEPSRLTQCGIASLRITSPPPTGTLTTKNNVSVTMDNCQDCWMADVAMHDTLGNVDIGPGGRRITLQKLDAVHTATVAKGAGYPADFAIRGSQVLIDRCTSSGDGSFYVATLNSSATCNVALNCTFKGKGSIQPHMRWSTGLLIDNCQLPDGRIEFINRKTAGSGHGWAIGWAVAWNCTAREYAIEQPPGAINWCIGCVGASKASASSLGIESPGVAVQPKSLYLAQLRERLGEQAVQNIGYK